MKNKRILTILLVISIAAGLCSCGNVSGTKTEKYSSSFFDAFDTVISITAFCESKEGFDKLFEEVHADFVHYHKLFDIYNDYDDMHNAKYVNEHAFAENVLIDDDFAELVLLSKEYYGMTDGNVNIAFGSVLKEWHDAREYAGEHPEASYVPDIKVLSECAKHCDINDIVLNEASLNPQGVSQHYIHFVDSELSIDLGAVAKGFATEKIAKKLIAEGYDNVLISAGGNVRCIGSKFGGDSWKVAVTNPDQSSKDSYSSLLSLSGKSAVTSGNYERFFECNGKRYHHIINKDSLMPLDDFASVTIVTEDSALADALSTAVFNMPFAEGKFFIESLSGVEAMWILSDYSIEYSSGFEKIISK